jgi:hypothetical protein
LGTVNVPEFSSKFDLTVVGDKLVFSTNEGSFGDLKIPAEWSTVIEDDERIFSETSDYRNNWFLLVVDGVALVGKVHMFVLFDKGAMHGKIPIKDNDGKLELSLEDWSEISFIPQGITQWEESPMITCNRVVYRIEEGTDEENGYTVAMLVVLEDKFIIFHTKLVFYQCTAKIEAKQIELPFPIQSFGRSITSQIEFKTTEHSGYYSQYFTDFTIKIGERNYNVCMSLGAFKDYSVDHRDRHYTLSAIYNKETCTTIFCGNADASCEMMDLGMTRHGIFSIEIPEFVAPETDEYEYEYSEMFDSLTHLPIDLQAFLRSITWCNPDA